MRVTPDVVHELLGAPRFLDEEMAERTRDPGVAIGLAWTPVGGEVLFVEASRMAGTGTLTLTGQLGDVMKESARAALSWVRAHATELEHRSRILQGLDIHLHVPAGAIPKDGPSAGVTMATALVSALTGRPVRGDLAMTGEITLSGRVLPVGGIKEKVLAARRAGVREVILPKQNEKNVNEDLDEELTRGPDHPPREHHRRSAAAGLAAGAAHRPQGLPPSARRRAVGEPPRSGKLNACGSSTRPAITSTSGPHVFPTAKYVRLHERVVSAGLAEPGTIIRPEMAAWEDLALVHTAEYPRRSASGVFRTEELAQLEIPWTAEVVDGFRLMAGGTIAAARLALEREPVNRAAARAVCHLGGGLHHAFADHGEGFCLFNDVAVAIRVLFRDGAVASAAVIDLDVHQGNGTATIFDGDARVFTFSMHQQYNYPVHKPPGSLDIGLPDGTKDEAYLDRLGGALKQVFDHLPEVVFYLAGADPYEDDQFGGLALTKRGLRLRDRMVLQAARHAGVPVVVLLAGGYARRLEDTVDIHFATVEEASRL